MATVANAGRYRTGSRMPFVPVGTPCYNMGYNLYAHAYRYTLAPYTLPVDLWAASGMSQFRKPYS